MTGRFRPNQRINIDLLRIRLDVSLSPLHEALARLAPTGLVVPVKLGYQIATLSRKDLENLGRPRRHIEKAAIGDAIR